MYLLAVYNVGRTGGDPSNESHGQALVSSSKCFWSKRAVPKLRCVKTCLKNVSYNLRKKRGGSCLKLSLLKTQCY